MPAMNKYGKYSVLLGVCAFICAILLSFSYSQSGLASGPLTELIATMLGSDNKSSTPEITSIGLFAIYESKIQTLLLIILIPSALLSGVFAVAAAKYDSSSLLYSIGIFSSFSSLMVFGILHSIIYIVVFSFLCLKNRKWKMTHA